MTVDHPTGDFNAYVEVLRDLLRAAGFTPSEATRDTLQGQECVAMHVSSDYDAAYLYTVVLSSSPALGTGTSCGHYKPHRGDHCGEMDCPNYYGYWPQYQRKASSAEVPSQTREDLVILAVIGRMYLNALDQDPSNEHLSLSSALRVTEVREAVERVEASVRKRNKEEHQ
jgi:hypothetical protein